MRSNQVRPSLPYDPPEHSASILTWRHVNLHGTYDFSNLLSANDPDYSLDDVINFKAV